MVQTAHPATAAGTTILRPQGWHIGFSLDAAERLLTVVNITVILATCLIEACLVFRVYLQVTGQSARGLSELVFDISGLLLSPFRRFETTTPIRTTAVLDISSLVAIEAYLAGALAILAFIWLVHRLVDAMVEERSLRAADAWPGHAVAPAGEENEAASR